MYNFYIVFFVLKYKKKICVFFMLREFVLFFILDNLDCLIVELIIEDLLL